LISAAGGCTPWVVIQFVMASMTSSMAAGFGHGAPVTICSWLCHRFVTDHGIATMKKARSLVE
jgi:hypothetical protein